MHNRLKYSASTAVLALAAGLVMAVPAAAAGLGPDPSYAPPALSWQGFYVGAHIGAGDAETNGSFQTSDEQVFFQDLALSGVLGGLQLGYNWDFGNLVVGVEGDWSGMRWRGVASAADSSDHAEGEIDNLYSIRGRLGITPDADRRVLLYGTVGVAWVDANITVHTDTRFNTDAENLKFDDAGLVAGGGVEWAASNSIRLRLETLYYLFDERRPITVTTNGAELFADLDNVWSVRVGASYYFNGPF